MGYFNDGPGIEVLLVMALVVIIWCLIKGDEI